MNEMYCLPLNPQDISIDLMFVNRNYLCTSYHFHHPHHFLVSVDSCNCSKLISAHICRSLDSCGMSEKEYGVDPAVIQKSNF